MKTLCVLLTVSLFSLTSCGSALQAVFDQTDQAIADKKLYNDGQARIYIVVPCDMTIGAYYRVLSDAQRAGVDSFCNPNATFSTGGGS